MVEYKILNFLLLLVIIPYAINVQLAEVPIIVPCAHPTGQFLYNWQKQQRYKERLGRARGQTRARHTLTEPTNRLQASEVVEDTSGLIANDDSQLHKVASDDSRRLLAARDVASNHTFPIPRSCSADSTINCNVTGAR